MAGGRYDGDVQMFVEALRDADPAHLSFLRWLVEHQKLERPISDASLEPDAEQVVVPGPERRERRPREWSCVPRWFGR